MRFEGGKHAVSSQPVVGRELCGGGALVGRCDADLYMSHVVCSSGEMMWLTYLDSLFCRWMKFSLSVLAGTGCVKV